MHTTNIPDLLILPPDDCRAVAKVPDRPDSVAGRQYAMLADAPYARTSDDVLWSVAADRADVPEADRATHRTAFFSRGQACFRASPLVKTHGWALHADGQGRIALLDPDGPDCAALIADAAVTKRSGMRSKRV